MQEHVTERLTQANLRSLLAQYQSLGKGLPPTFTAPDFEFLVCRGKISAGTPVPPRVSRVFSFVTQADTC